MDPGGGLQCGAAGAKDRFLQIKRTSSGGGEMDGKSGYKRDGARARPVEGNGWKMEKNADPTEGGGKMEGRLRENGGGMEVKDGGNPGGRTQIS
eukprot:gene15794-biopygen6704